MVFKKMLRAFGVGGPSVDTVLDSPDCRPGGHLTGNVHVMANDHDVNIEYVTLGLVTRMESERGDSEFSSTVEFHRLPVTGGFRLAAGEKKVLPFQFPIPWETPITHVYGNRLRGMTMGIRTELAVAKAVDKGDLDEIAVHPLPAQERILDALERSGFRFKYADLEQGQLYGIAQELPFYQEIEFYPPQHVHGINEIEVTFVANPRTLNVILEADKRGGFLSSGHDTYGHLEVDPATMDNTDWAARINSWIQDVSAGRSSGFTGSHGGYHGGHHGGFHGHGHGRHHGGMGMGTVVGGAAVGFLGGMAAGEMMEEMFEEED